MVVRFKVEMRKINGLRFARFNLIDDVHVDSREEVLIAAALRECEITHDENAGMFKNLVEAADGTSALRIGGIDVPVAAIEEFTTALTDNGFEVA